MRIRLRAWLFGALAAALTFTAIPAVVWAEEPAAAAATPAATPAPTVNPADTAFMLVCAALVMLMTPGLGLFYAGMVRRKNVLGTFQQSFIMLGVISLQWVLFGYSLAFGPNKLYGFIGGLEWFGLRGVGFEPNADYAATIPHQLFMVYQLMFAIITPALISGAFAERMKFSAYLVFSLLWATFVYDPVAHWVWGTGGLIKQNLGALDFAGGLVVHLISGVAALCCVLVMGKRKGLGQEEMHPHNLMMTALGTGLLWFGWFGFNAGSALAANGSAVAAFVNTNTAAGVATLTWMVIEWIHKGKGTVLGACTGAVAGLVAITPAAGFVTPMGSIAMGVGVCVICYGAVLLKGKLGYDDSLDVFGVHGVGGAFGALAVGILAKAGISGDVNGLLYGNAMQLGYQALSLVIAGTYSFVVTFILLKIVDVLIGLRVTTDEEEVGLDLAQHGERGYIMGVGELMGGHASEAPSNGHYYPSASPEPIEEAEVERVGY
ncbi:ammonium transporter [Singulisphaera sp. PoT]|uniref:ammonium transporter n=1 Tax=Singulisphaera sp. PoT TaxID=3411797 RepID=UPI003BF5256F